MGVVSDLAGRARSRGSQPIVGRLLLCGGLALLVLASLLLYREIYASRIFPGIRVDSIELGGLTVADSQARLNSKFGRDLGQPLIVEVNGRIWRLSRTDLGAHYDVGRLSALAYSVGREGSAFEQLFTPVAAWLSPRELDASMELSPADWASILQPIESEVTRPPADARVTISADHQVQISPDRDGIALDRAAAQRLISAAVLSQAVDPIQLPVAPTHSAVTSKDLQQTRVAAQTILSAPVTVQYGDQTWDLSVDEIQAALTIPPAPSAGSVTPNVEPSLVSGFVDRIAGDVERPARDARLALVGDKVVLQAGVTARAVDRDETAKRVWSAIQGNPRKIEPAVNESQPAVRDDDLTTSLALANTIIQGPVGVTGPNNRRWTLAARALRDMLVLPTSGRDGPAPHLDATKLTAFVARIAHDVDVAPLNARFQRDGAGQVSLLRDGLPGLAVDQADAARLIATATVSANRNVSLPVQSIAPTVTAADASQLVGLQLLADNSTSYAGSIPPRRHNVEFATSLLNGVVVAPGDIFSFNHEMGPTTLDRGFQVGYGIEAQGDSVKTVPSVAGGICQVATTLFQPVFWTGYTIEERYAHAYWISHYTSHGMVGLDTTVDEEAGLDFRFKNDTSTDILIQTSTDGTNVHFALYGVPPTWTVQVDQPVVTNLIKTDPKVVVQEDPTMPKGTQVITEAAQNGFTVTIRRTVTDSAGNSRQLNLRSNYAPAHNVIAVGTKI